MKIEYFAEGCLDCPIVLIYGNKPGGVLNLRLALERLATGLVDNVAIHRIPGYTSINNCQLFAGVGDTNRGLYQIAGEPIFECSLQSESWLDIIGLLEPFTVSNDKDKPCFQFLDETSKITLMISTQRTW